MGGVTLPIPIIGRLLDNASAGTADDERCIFPCAPNDHRCMVCSLPAASAYTDVCQSRMTRSEWNDRAWPVVT